MSKAKVRKLSTTITSLPKSKRSGAKRGMTGQYKYGFADPPKKSRVRQPKGRGKPAVEREDPMIQRDRALDVTRTVAAQQNRRAGRIPLRKTGWPKL